MPSLFRFLAGDQFTNEPTFRSTARPFGLLTLLVIAVTTLSTPPTIWAQLPPAAHETQVAEPADQVADPMELVTKLSKALTNTKWTGSFTVHGANGAPKTESYEIKKAEHQGNDQWLLTARIAYGDRDVTVPIPLEIKWAGKTPVITVDNLTIPGLGTFDARVLMRKGSYAGTWTHGEKGGHLFGKYKKMEAKKREAESEK